MPFSEINILVIDDNEDILFMLQAMLQLKGYKVSIKENTDNLEPFIKNLEPDLILMDMLLSGTDGRVVCKQLKSNPSFFSIPIVMLSAHPQGKEDCLAAGANYFLSKPFEMDGLFQVIDTALQSN